MLGLTESEAVKQRKKYGSNEIIKKKNNSFWKLLIESLGDPIIKILLLALAIKVVFLFKDFDWYETIGILIAIFLASFISSISEYGSNKAFESLQKESMLLKSKVYRNNKLTEIYNKDIVKDDIVKISMGDKIPADGIIIEGNLTLDESFITGESKEVYKKINNEVYSGSIVYKGSALIKITKVGENSFIGGISSSLQIKDEESPLKSKLRILAKSISRLGYIGAILASVAYLFMKIVVDNNFDLDLILITLKDFSLMFDYLIYCLTLSVTIIIMAVPEGLPMMITLVLSSNMKKMLKDKVLVRKMVGIETSGSLNVLLCDKTGTLTKGQLNVVKIIDGNACEYQNENELKKSKQLFDLIFSSLSLNTESSYVNGKAIDGNITDKAITRFIKDYNTNIKIIKRKEFTSEDKYSYVKTNDKVYFKGASEVLLKHVTKIVNKDGTEKNLYNIDTLERIINKYTEKGYRVLINCYGDNERLNNLTFICLIIIEDSIRKEAPDALKTIKQSGVKVVMITGDAKKTAINVANKLGLTDSQSIILTHDEISKMTDNDIYKILDDLTIVARALPQDKSRLVSLYKEKGLVVGMTGDGVNDALALKKSDVGFALGSGSEVAKEASDIVVIDNNIMSICKAILYGRTIFKSIRKFITYQLTVNVCALILSILGTLFGITSPITIIQMLWINMIMDTFAGLAFSYEPPLLEYMKELPKKKDEKILNKYMLTQIVINGLFSFILCMLFLKLPFITNYIRNDSKYLMTAFFALFIFLGIINSFLSRTHRINIFAHLLKNKVFLIINIFIFTIQLYIIYYGGSLFRTYGLTLKELLFVLSYSLLILPIDFLRKCYLKHKKIPLGV